MTVVRDFEDWPRGSLHLAIGAFDGVHLGHQALVRGLIGGAQAAGATTMAATFDPLPGQVLGQDPPQSTIADAPERASLLLRSGVDAVAILTFDRSFSNQSPADFIARIAGAGAVRRIVVGSEFQFGHERQGSASALKALGAHFGFAVTVVEPLALGGKPISSGRIRDAIRMGDLAASEALLGRPYSVTGTIVRGDQRGRVLGFPTINVQPPPDKLLPRDGIYATWVSIDGQRYLAASSLGTRPTFGGGPRKLESFILDFSGELYGREATVSFVQRLRDELRFDSARELASQIALDVQQTRVVLR